MGCMFIVCTFLLLFGSVWGWNVAPRVLSSCGASGCSRSLGLQVSVGSSEEDNWVVNFTLSNDTKIKDDSGRAWAVSSPVHVQLRKFGSSIRHDLLKVNQVCGVYESRTALSNTQDCPLNSLCCPPQKPEFAYTLQKNYSQCYNVFSISRANPQAYISAYATQDENFVTSTVTVEGGEVASSDGGLIMSAYQHTSESDYPIYDDSYLLTRVSNNDDGNELFLVPQEVFSYTANHIGMTAASYLASTTCSSIGSTVAVEGGHPNDQFSNYRSSHMYADTSCMKWAEMSTTDPYDYPQQVFVCDDKLSVDVMLELDSNKFQLRSVEGSPVVTTSGCYPLRSGDEQAVLYMDIYNPSSQASNVDIRSLQCCSNSFRQPNCSDITVVPIETVSVLPLESTRASFFLTSPTAISTLGSCTFQLLQDQVQFLEHTVFFNTSYAWDPNDVKGNNPCGPTLNTVIVNGTALCLIPCTRDQNFNATIGVCYPVDCTAKYGGIKNYYSHNSGLCEAVIPCLSDLYYNSILNVCEDNSTAKPRAAVLRASITAVAAPLDCGPHGAPDPTNTTCICDEGYTLANSSLGTGVMCRTSLVGQTPVGAQNSTTGGSNLILFGVLPPIVWIPLVVGIGVISICVAICCLRCRTKESGEMATTLKLFEMMMLYGNGTKARERERDREIRHKYYPKSPSRSHSHSHSPRSHFQSPSKSSQPKSPSRNKSSSKSSPSRSKSPSKSSSQPNSPRSKSPKSISPSIKLKTRKKPSSHSDYDSSSDAEGSSHRRRRYDY